MQPNYAALVELHEDRIQGIESKVHATGIELARTETYQKTLSKQVERLDEKVERLEDNLHDKIDVTVEKAVVKITEVVNAKVGELGVRVEGVKKQVEKHGERLGALENTHDERMRDKEVWGKALLTILGAVAGIASTMLVEWFRSH